MTWVLFFSFGVERGRRLVLNVQTSAPLAQLPSPEAVPEPIAMEVPIAATVVTETTVPITVEGATEKEVIQVPVEKVLTDNDLFTIQVASYKQDSAAQREAKRLSESGYEIFVLPKGSYRIVCVGKFAEKEQAKEFSKKLKSKYTDLLVRRF